MKTVVLISSLCLACVGSASVPKDWQVRYEAMNRLLEHKRLGAFKAMFSPDFYSVDPKGWRQNRLQFFRQVDGICAMADKISAKIRINNVTQGKGITGRPGPVDVSYVFDLVAKDRKGRDMAIREVGTDSWRREGGKWLCYMTVDKSLTETPIGRKR